MLLIGAGITASSALAQSAPSRDQCIQTLNGTANNSLSISGSVSISAPNCGIQVNSSSSSALRVAGSATITSKYAKVVGGTSLTGSPSITPAPQTGQTAQADPLTFLAPPPSRQCDFTDFRITGTSPQTLVPGTYCNGIAISGSPTVTFQPGVYVIRGGGLDARGSAVLNGANVTFFLTQGTGYTYGPLSVGGSVQMNLSAPAAMSSPYYGILFYQDPAIGTGKPASAFGGSDTSAISGVFYFPTTGLSFSGTASAGNYLIFIADTLSLTGNVQLNANFPSGRSPLLPPISVGVTPATVNLQDGGTQAFTAVVQNAINPAVQWTINPSNAGTISGAGVYTAPSAINSQQTVTATATSVEDPTKTGTATITLAPAVRISVTPTSQTLYASQQQQFIATVANTQNPSVTWTVAPAGSGTISASGVYTAPASITAQQNVTITVRSDADPTKSATATVTLMPPVSISVAPATANLIEGQSQQFSATVINAINAAVSWTISPAGVGTITANGLYTAPTPVGSTTSVTITATSQADSTKAATATVTLMPVQVSVSPASVTLGGGATNQFTGTVISANSSAVTWTIQPSVGSINAAGLYTAPAVVSSAQTVTVTATSNDNPSKTASATISLVPVTITVSPTALSLFVRQTQQFTATVGNASDTSVAWSISPATGAGSINGSGLYTAPTTLASQQTVTITAASTADPSKTASATITLVPVTVTASPSAKTLFVGNTQQFTASVNNAADTTVTWSLNPATGAGTLNSSGLYTAPSSIAAQQTVTITATSNADSSKTATATVTLVPVTITISPASGGTLFTGQTLQFSATASNATDTSVTWSLSPATGAGTISGAGLYTAPSSISAETTVTVKATSNADATKFATATIALAPVTVSVTPATTTVSGGGTAQFNATVTNATNTAVTWSISPATGAGTISSSGLYTAPATVTAQQAVTITATSQADASKAATATATLLVTTITVNPQTATLLSGQTQQFTASSANVNWSISPAGVGAITSTGLYTAPASIGAQQSVTVTATLQANASISASASITLTPVAITVSPTTKTVVLGGTQQFTASVSNTSNTNVTWSIIPATGAGTISASGLYTAPAAVASQQAVSITATSQADNTKAATATVTLIPVSVTVTPASKTLFITQTQQFSAAVTNSVNTGVTWSISPATGAGTISASTGSYTAPATLANQQTVTITATSQGDPAQSATATVTLQPVSISINPTTKTLYAGGNQQFVPTVTNAPTTNLTWTINPVVGTISSTGFYQAPASIGTQQAITVTATSQSDTSRFTTATITLQPVLISMTPTTATLSAAQTVTLSVLVSGPNTGVTWSLSPATGAGTITQSGVYTAPSCIALKQTVTAIATSTADPSQSASATITLLNASGYSYQRGIVIDHTKVGNSDLSNFPVLISGTYGYLATTANGGRVQNPSGYDIAFFADAAGTSKLDFEIESYNPATGQIAAWVRIPLLSRTRDTLIYLNYGNSAITASQGNPAGVWDSGFKAVFHLGSDTALNTADSTTNATNGTNVNGVTAVSGMIGGAGGFNGSGQFINGSGLNLANSPLTISLWQKANSPSDHIPFSMGTSPSPHQFLHLLDRSSTIFRFGLYLDDIDVTVPSMNNVWAHTVVTLDASKKQTVYWNGAEAGSRTTAEMFTGASIWSIGRNVPFNGNFFNGTIDEVRVSNVARSADWIAAEYSNQSAPQSWYTIQTENLVALGVEPASAALYSGWTQQFNTTTIGTCIPTVTWSLSPAVGSISSSGLYTAPASVTSQQQVTITASIASAPPQTATAKAILLPPLTISVIPVGGTLYAAQSKQFSAAVSNAINGSVVWSVSPQTGSISQTGVYTAPAVISSPQTVLVIATAVADPSKSASVQVQLAAAGENVISQSVFGLALGAVAQSLCRAPHTAPVVNAGADQVTNLTSNGAVVVPLQGAADIFFLTPGQSLSYTWSLSSGPAPVTFSAASAASTNATFTAAGFYTLQLSVNDGIATSVGTTHVTINPASNDEWTFLMTPNANGPFATGGQATLQIALAGRFTNNSPIHLVITGANPRTVDLVADGNGRATFTHTGANPGVDTINGSATGWCCGTPTFNSNTVTVEWKAAPARLSSSPVTGRFYTNDGSGVFNTPASQQPVFTQTFPNINFDPPAGTGNSTSITDVTRPFTDVTTDSSGVVTGTIAAQGNSLQAGTGTLFNFSAAYSGALTVPAAGPVTFTFQSDDAFVIGVGNGATAGGSNPRINAPGSTFALSLPVMAAVNQRGNSSPQTVVVNFPAAGTYNYEVDYAKGGDAKLTLQMLAASNGAPIPAGVQLTLTPAQAAPLRGGAVQTFSLLATDTNGLVFANANATVNITGPNQQTRAVVTDSTGRVNFSYSGSGLNPGTDQIQATATINGMSATSNLVSVIWNDGTNKAPVVSAGGDQTVTLPSAAILSGQVSDDGLPSNTLTITWSKVSGPGTVTFDAANQAVTAASFSVPGTYVLQLSASDGALTTTSTVKVTATGNPNWSSGWIAAPLDKGSVSGLVPVTLTSGITLTSGTLSYYPANKPGAVVTISTAAIGSGTVGTFDTTQLENGGYFLTLNGTNSAGVTQNNVAYVTVSGEYKPGRVTATVTDFTVPSTGLAIHIQRHYDSLQKDQVGDFGLGWKLGLQSLNFTAGPTGDVTLTIGGRRRTFYFTPPPNQIFIGWYTPQYTGEPGFYGSLVNMGDNCNGVLQRVGNVWQCAIANAGASYQPTGYRYTDPYGRVYTLAGDGTLQSLRDLNGNTLTIALTGITSTTGLNIPFVRDTEGRITRITDSVGKQYNYTYDAAGNLSTVALPSIVSTILYGYDSTHLLTSERDPRGNTGTSTYYSDGKLKSVTDAAGQLTQFAYDVPNRTTTVTNPDGGVAVTVADAYGMPLSVRDPLNRTTTYSYDANHNALTETNPLGQTTTFTYDANGFKTSLKDPLNNVWSATYNAVGGPTAVTNPLSQTQSVTYDANFNIAAITDPIGQVAAFTYTTTGLPATLRDARGNTSSYGYDAYGNRTSYVDPLSRTTASAYDTMGRLTSQADPRSNATGFAYDDLGRKTSMTDAYGKVTSYTYDDNGNKLTETDPLGRTTTFTYDAVNRVAQVRYPDLTTRGYTYDYRGNKLTQTDQLGRVTRWVYDLAGQLTSMTYAFGTAEAATVSHTYDGAGRKLTDVDARGNTTTNTYDAAGRLISVRDAVGNLTQFGYDAKGQRTSMTDAKNRVTTYTYDSRGRQLVTTYPGGSTTSKVYDGLGMVTSATDEENRTTQYVFDAASQLTKVIDALNQQTQYGYDLSGNKVSQTDARGNTTTYVWDKLNRRTSRTLPLGQSEAVAYDFVGNKTSRTDFNGKTTSYGYDALNRLLSRTPDASFAAPAIVFTYTATGQRASMSDASGSTTYTYDNRDRLKTKATPQGTLTYTYDAASNVTSTVSSNAGGTNVAYAWDANNRLQSVADGGGSTSYNYDATNQLASFAYPNGVTHGYTYDKRDRMTNLAVNGPSGLIASYGQGFSLSGRKTDVTENTGRTVNYNYDPIYRLLGETIAGATPAGALTYSLDPVGNRLSLASTLAGISAQAATYDANDRLTSDVYDANGNTKTSGGVNYTYDFEDRLLSASSGVQFIYDGDGNRVGRTEAGATTRYLVDDRTSTGYAQVAEEILTGALAAKYIYGTSRISQSRNGTVSYYGYDDGGSVRQLLSDVGILTDTYLYDAFGETIAQTGSTTNSFLYRGEQFDASLKTYYLRARYYQPNTGRFLTSDPIDSNCGCPSCRCTSCNSKPTARSACAACGNLFLYANGDPIGRKDPSGLNSILGTSIRDTSILVLGTASLIVLRDEISCIVEAIGSVLTLALSDTFDFQAVREECHFKKRRRPNCSDGEKQDCQKLYEYCSGRNCGSCLSYCLTQCEWPFERCPRFRFPPDPADMPPSPWPIQ